MKYAFIEAHRARYPVPAMCELLEVSCSGYHTWRGRGPSPREQENNRLLMQIRAIHSASHGSYGSPRVHEELRDQGKVVSLNRVRRLMKKNGIAARHKRKFRATTDSRHNLPVAPNLLGQEFVTECHPSAYWSHCGFRHIGASRCFAVMEPVADRHIGASGRMGEAGISD